MAHEFNIQLQQDQSFSMRSSNWLSGDHLLTKGPMKQSTHLTELSSQHIQHLPQKSQTKTHMAYSTFLQYPQPLSPAQQSHRHSLKVPNTTDIKRVRSLKSLILTKEPNPHTREAQNQFNNNVMRLRMEELTFKYKIKISTLLKQINASSSDLDKLSQLDKVEDILSFLSQKVREKLVINQIKENNIDKVRQKEKMTLSEYESEIYVLSTKLREKESAQKIIKTKLRESYEQNQLLLQKLSLKEKELSTKSTQLYQLKTGLKEKEKNHNNIKEKCELLERSVVYYKEQMQIESRDIISSNKQLQIENLELRDKVEENEVQLQRMREKNATLAVINGQLSEELVRWKERLDYNEPIEKVKKSMQCAEGVARTKLSTTSMNCFPRKYSEHSHQRLSLATLQIQNTKLQIKIEQLQKNRQLSKDNLNPSAYKKSQIIQLSTLKEQPRQIWQVQLSKHFLNKVEDIAKQWKDKLSQMVNKYEDELEVVKQKEYTLLRQNEEKNNKITILTNDKHDLQKKLTARQKQIYSLLKVYKTVNKTEESPGSFTFSQNKSLAQKQQRLIKTQNNLDTATAPNNCQE